MPRARDEIATLDGAGHAFDHEAVLAGRLTPVFFGSAANNFGVQLLLDSFVDLAPGPAPRLAADGEIRPDDARFSGFVFKIQANMDPRHRDRIYFIRLVSGRFERDMNAVNTRTGKAVRLSNAQRVFARTRETLDEGYAGDVIGIVGNHDFHIGDTVSDDPVLKFDEIPRFPPECFALLQNPNPSNFKRFREGLDQLLKEGVAQAFELPDSLQRVPLLGAVGPLQFEVMQYRLESEYSADCRVESASWQFVRWPLDKSTGAPILERPDLMLPTGCVLAMDSFGQWVVLLPSSWTASYLEEKNSAYAFIPTPPSAQPAVD